MKRDPVKEALDRLRGSPSDDELRLALGSRYDIVVARAAEAVARRQIEGFTPALTTAFERLLRAGVTGDRGCLTKVALLEALLGTDARAEEVYLQGVAYRQLEPGLRGPQDTAGELRGLCAMGLVRGSYPNVLELLAELLADAQPAARALAAAAVGANVDESGASLLRLTLLQEREPGVVGAAVGALFKLTPDRAAEFVERCVLPEASEEVLEDVLLALGDARHPSAYELLLRQDPSPDVFLAMAMTRLPQAIEHLLAQHCDDARVALRKIYLGDSFVMARLEQEEAARE